MKTVSLYYSSTPLMSHSARHQSHGLYYSSTPLMSHSARHQSHDTVSLYYSSTPLMSHSARHLPTFFSNCSEELYKIKISLIIKECPEEILIKLVNVLKISKSS